MRFKASFSLTTARGGRSTFSSLTAFNFFITPPQPFTLTRIAGALKVGSPSATSDEEESILLPTNFEIYSIEPFQNITRPSYLSRNVHIGIILTPAPCICWFCVTPLSLHSWVAWERRACALARGDDSVAWATRLSAFGLLR